MDEYDDHDEGLSHSELVAVTKGKLNELIANDPLLCDLPRDVTLNEINSQIAVQTGTAITVSVVRFDGETLKIVVDKNGKLIDLRHAIQRHIELMEFRETSVKRNISWRYVWKTYGLITSDGECFNRTHDMKSLKDLNIYNKCTLQFVKIRRNKNKTKS